MFRYLGTCLLPPQVAQMQHAGYSCVPRRGGACVLLLTAPFLGDYFWLTVPSFYVAKDLKPSKIAHREIPNHPPWFPSS